MLGLVVFTVLCFTVMSLAHKEFSWGIFIAAVVTGYICLTLDNIKFRVIAKLKEAKRNTEE
ncbi:hypothetical protein D3C87_1412430 [compost metagenome]